MNQMINKYARTERKKGIVYHVKEVLDIIHKAFLCTNGIDPLEGIPMDCSLISIYKISENNKLVGREKILRRPHQPLYQIKFTTNENLLSSAIKH